jgi:uncharacterized protein involved in outer membrane biogenesis
MRKTLFVIGGVVGALAAIVAALLLLVDVNQFREPIRAQLEKRLKRTVSIGKLGLKVIPLSIRLDDVAIGEAPQFSSKAPFVAAKQMYVRVGLGALLRKKVEVESLVIEQPALELIKDAGGQWNFATLGESSGASGGTGGGGDTSNIGIADLRIEDGRVAITDLQQKKPRAVYDHIDLTLKDFKPGRKFEFTAQAHLPGQGKELIAAHLTAVTPAMPAKLAGSDLDGDVSIEDVSLAGLQSFLGSTPSAVAKSVFNGKMQFQSRGGTLDGKGGIDISEPQLKQPAKIEFAIRQDTGTGVLTVSSVTISLGGLSASGNARVDTKAVPSTLTAEVRTTGAAVADVLNLAEAFGALEGVSGTGTLSLEVHLSGPVDALAYDASGSLRNAKLTLATLRKPVEIQALDLKATKDSATLNNLVAAVGSSHLKGNLTVRNFAHPDVQFTADIDRLDTAELEQLVVPSTGAKSGSGAPAKSGGMNLNGSGTISVGTITYNQIALNNVRATCKLDNGIIRLDPLTAKLFGGDQSGSIMVDTRQQQTAFNVAAKINKVDANKLVSATTSLKQILFGMLSGDLDVHADPRPGQDVAQSLNGTVKVQLTDGKLMGVHLMNQIASVAKFLGYAPSNDAFTNIVKLAGTLNIQNGIANTNDLMLQFDGGSLAAAGTMGLADRSLKMKVTAILPKDLSERAGGSRIGGFMSTALSNSKGELVIPAIVSGTFDKPRFEPDPQRIAKMKLDGLLPTRDNPLAAASKIQGILGALTGAKSATAKPESQPGAAPAAPQKKPSIFDVIESVRKKAEQK